MHAPRYYYKNRKSSCTTDKYGVREDMFMDLVEKNLHHPNAVAVLDV